MNTHLVVDETYYPEEEEFYVAFVGSERECWNFFEEQSRESCVNTYKVVPMTEEELKKYNPETALQ